MNFQTRRLCLSFRKGWNEFPVETEDKRPHSERNGHKNESKTC